MNKRRIGFLTGEGPFDAAFRDELRRLGYVDGENLVLEDGGGRRCGGLSGEAGMDELGFPQPEVRESHRSVLRTALHACISTNEMLDQNAQPPETVEIHPPTFEGTIPGPTFKVKPGDKLSILLVNDLPSNPTNERDHAFPHDENTLNLHTHGLTVSPKAHPVVPGSSISRAGASNPKRGWVRFFREVLIGRRACRRLSCGAAAGAGLSARLCGDCRARRYPSNSSGDSARRAGVWFRTRRAGRSADCIGRQTR